MAKKTLKEKLEKKKEDLKNRSNFGSIRFLKDGDTIRVRLLPMGEENEFIKEVTQFYLGGDIKGVISPATFGEPCAIMDAYTELKNSKDDNEKELASKFPPKNKYLAFCLIYKDEKGRELDEKNPMFVLLSGGQYQSILDLYLDDEEWGDMTDPENGYDLKLSRTGSGKTDTEYAVKPCKNTPIHKSYKGKVYDLDEEVRKIMPTYEKTKEFIEQYLQIDPDEDDDKPKRKRDKKRNRKPDID